MSAIVTICVGYAAFVLGLMLGSGGNSLEMQHWKDMTLRLSGGIGRLQDAWERGAVHIESPSQRSKVVSFVRYEENYLNLLDQLERGTIVIGQDVTSTRE